MAKRGRFGKYGERKRLERVRIARKGRELPWRKAKETGRKERPQG